VSQSHYIAPAGMLDEMDVARAVADKTGLAGLIIAGYDKDCAATAVWAAGWYDLDWSYPTIFKNVPTFAAALEVARTTLSAWPIVSVLPSVWVHLHYKAAPLDRYLRMTGHLFPGCPRQ